MNQMPLGIKEALLDWHIITQAAFGEQEALHGRHIVDRSVETNYLRW